MGNRPGKHVRLLIQRIKLTPRHAFRSWSRRCFELSNIHSSHRDPTDRLWNWQSEHSFWNDCDVILLCYVGSIQYRSLQVRSHQSNRWRPSRLRYLCHSEHLHSSHSLELSKCLENPQLIGNHSYLDSVCPLHLFHDSWHLQRCQEVKIWHQLGSSPPHLIRHLNT